MNPFDLKIHRIKSFPRSMLGELFVGDERLCYTLELPWLWNQSGVSCVPPGKYKAFVRRDKPDGWRIQLRGVPGRSGIQIHIGNYPKQIQGCVLVGTKYGVDAVFESKQAYGKLKAAFHGGAAPNAAMNRPVAVEFTGLLASPWGDFSSTFRPVA